MRGAVQYFYETFNEIFDDKLSRLPDSSADIEVITVAFGQPLPRP